MKLAMTVLEIAPDVDRAALLSGAQFIDAYSIAVDDGALNARLAAQRMIMRQPRWAKNLLTLRDLLVRPFGLKTSAAGETSSPGNGVESSRLSARRPIGWSPGSTTATWTFASWSMLRLPAIASR